MDKSDLGVVIFAIVMGMAFVSIIFSFWVITQNKEEHICIERQCPSDPYSDMYKPCNPVKCITSEDAVIVNKVYSVYANRTQVGLNFNVTTIPDDATITGTSWYGWDGCYQNETGQDPNDLVMHLICPNNKEEQDPCWVETDKIVDNIYVTYWNKSCQELRQTKAGDHL